MTVGKKIFVLGLLVTGGLVLVGLGGFFGVTRLDDADKWGSVVGAVVALLGLPMTLYGLVLARRAGHGSATSGPPVSGASGEVHQQVVAGRDAYTAGRDQHFGGGGPGSTR